MPASSRIFAVLVVGAVLAVGIVAELRPASDNTPPPAELDSRININTADAAALTLLPGIGGGYAQRIVDHRDEHGPFRSLEDIDAVKGIGPAILKRIEPWITFGGEVGDGE